MVTNKEIAHVRALKKWSAEARQELQSMRTSAIGKILDKMTALTGQSPEVVNDNMEYLIAIVEREYTAQRVRHLSKLNAKPNGEMGVT